MLGIVRDFIVEKDLEEELLNYTKKHLSKEKMEEIKLWLKFS